MQIHRALLISTTCQRLSLGMFILCVLANQFMGVSLPMHIVAIVTLILLAFGGIASAFHLARPQRFFNAFSNFGSHLTQEAFITPFLGVALLICCADGLLFDLGMVGVVIQWVAFILAIAFLISTGLVYQLSSRPAWNTPLVLIIFLLTAAQAGTLATDVMILAFGQTIPVGMVALSIIAFVACLIAQIAYIQRLKSVGYGVDVNVTDSPYKGTWLGWLIFGVILVIICLVATLAVPFLALSLAAVVCSIIGIVFWTILFYKVALKVKMFPMYEVDLNIYM
ncbi:MAG: hypothetical protein E7224_05690 [Clostridiales bacterium]|nr:hypothetical protein [Clostridiales bacterium]